MSNGKPLRVRVEVTAAPTPGLLRPAIERRLRGRAFPSGPEDAIGKAVADALAGNARRSKP
jgi:hypothetical protein